MRLSPVGADSLLVDLDTPEEAQAWHAQILNRRSAGTLPPVREVVPGEKTVLMYGVGDIDAMAAELRHWSVPALTGDSGPLVEIPVRYDGADLPAVAELWGVSEQDVAGIHSSTQYRVAFCGFVPGFAYMLGLQEPYHVPRKAEPRTSVPAGSVALAGPYTGIYPRASPGGWQLIGTTDVGLWDMERDPAALLAPGTRVRFIPQPVTRDRGGSRRTRQAETKGGRHNA
ncbi:allophanate hydrolase subunit 1 [Streptomyces sp. PKU-EA00015]|uniref:5-oxoprolinase subunit B family protein n=1 Tax=Streptomyces sp. PKU-EA00015 TaxID=2748326 RepID=UPI0015A106B1|nr:allophanate hydrolase subunit 1 [Streptomyces sp. PKU-EA00015]NWF27405.1 allophanate hydrolase subunit 1 [Streptomyces sp. PKU-EA00015]